MAIMNRGWYLSILSLVIIWVSLVACSRLAQQSGPTQEKLNQRVMAYWDALRKGELENAFDFIEPEANTPKNRYRFISGMSNFDFTEYTIESITISGTKANVKVKRTFTLRPGIIPLPKQSITQTMEEPWIFSEGTWYWEFQEPKSPFVNTGPSRELTPAFKTP